MSHLKRQVPSWLAAAIVLAVGAYLIYDYALSNRGNSKTSQVNEIAYCLGFFDSTRALRIRYKLGDGADELGYMHSLAASYAQFLKKYDASGFQFGPSVNSGRADAASFMLGAIVAAFDTGSVDMRRWLKAAEKCRDTATTVRRLIDSVPDRPHSAVAADAIPRPAEEAAKLCVCDGKLRSGVRAGIFEARVALNDLSPAIARIHEKFKDEQSEAASTDVPAVKRARERRRKECESGRTEAEVALNSFPAEFLRQTRLFDECYELANASRK